MQLGPYTVEPNCILGEGSNNTKVILGADASGKKYAVKAIHRKSLTIKTKKMVEQEIKCLKKVHHPNIIKLFDVYEKDDMTYIVEEYVGGGDLFDCLTKDFEKFSESTCKRYFLQIAKAVSFLHANGFIHHDIKLENTGLKEDGEVVLMDFGFCSEFSSYNQLSSFCGTLAYSAPELLTGKEYNPTPIDIWALGVLLFVLLAKKFPFDSENHNTLYKQATSRDYIHNLIKSTPMTEDARDLLLKILNPVPVKRISAIEILHHRWLRNADFVVEHTD